MKKYKNFISYSSASMSKLINIFTKIISKIKKPIKERKDLTLDLKTTKKLTHKL